MPPAPFALVLAGGGARGFAHAGVLRVLDRAGLKPAGLVGVSMGAVVAATYAARSDWFEALMDADIGDAPAAADPHAHGALATARTAWNLVHGWGAPAGTGERAMAGLRSLLGEVDFSELRLPVVVCATDLVRGERVEFDSGPVAPAVYASAALAGVLPPRIEGDRVLVDGVYADMAPVDVARRLAPTVAAVDPRQIPPPGSLRNGLQTVMRAMEVCHATHADARLRTADVVIRPVFRDFVDVLDFGARRRCVAAGEQAAREVLDELDPTVG